MQAHADEAPPPLARHAVLHSDQPCPCGYNLFGQKVERDGRLGFDVVRCPECGRFSPAGHATPAARPWLRRAAVLLLALWALVFAGVVLAATLALWGLYVGSTEPFLVSRVVEQGTDRPLVENYEGLGNTRGPMRYFDARTNAEVPPGRAEEVRVPRGSEVARLSTTAWNYGHEGPPWWVWPLLLAFDALIGLGLGTLVAAGLWHVGRARWAFLLWAAVPVALAWLNLAAQGDDYRLVHGWYFIRVGTSAAATLAAAALGLAFGRRIARGLARLLVPPGPRQALAFLWHADRLAMPLAGPRT